MFDKPYTNKQGNYFVKIFIGLNGETPFALFENNGKRGTCRHVKCPF